MKALTIWPLGIVVLLTLVLGTGAGVCKWDDEQKLDNLIQAARGGDTDAMCDLALAYYNGDGVLKDPFKAKCWIKKAHDLGENRAEKIWNRLKLWEYSGKCALGFDDHPRPENRADDRYRDPYTGMTFVWLPGKCFRMGCDDTGDERCGRDEAPEHRVCLDGFWMGEYEVTQKQWMQVMGSNPSRFKGEDLPVEQVSFQDVRTFIRKLNQVTGHRFSLPTETQWEFACRSRGRRSVFPWGREDYQPSANCGGCDSGSVRGRTAPVGSYLPNEAGIYDMGGNVREWCRDTYDPDAYKKAASENRTERTGKKKPAGKRNAGKSRVVRGGSFVDPLSASRCRARGESLSQMKSHFLGFRLSAKKLD
ncbi:MAG: SUMF1/EgtB/PvdO family nonheme iron enzyme [Desulfobacterales bacterium]|nr:SUMF1/EgtB/PvdO family nonheme iron enzyme [Desulfobacterales bacterium]